LGTNSVPHQRTFIFSGIGSLFAIEKYDVNISQGLLTRQTLPYILSWLTKRVASYAMNYLLRVTNEKARHYPTL